MEHWVSAAVVVVAASMPRWGFCRTARGGFWLAGAPNLLFLFAGTMLVEGCDATIPDAAPVVAVAVGKGGSGGGGGKDVTSEIALLPQLLVLPAAATVSIVLVAVPDASFIQAGWVRCLPLPWPCPST